MGRSTFGTRLTANYCMPSQAQGGSVASVPFHPTGRVLASGADDGSVNLWDTTDGKIAPYLSRTASRGGRRGLRSGRAHPCQG